MDGSRIILAAHRGDKFNFPENTMSAFRSALEKGVDMIETDIRRTKDGELILIHDRSGLRTTGVDKNVDEMTLQEVRALDAGNGEKIPTVKEFIALVKDTDVLVNWELKMYPDTFGDEVAFGVADQLIELIEQNDMVERSMLNSFSARVLEHIYERHGRRFPLHGLGILGCSKTKDTPKMPIETLYDWCCLYADVKGESVLQYKKNFDYCLANNIWPCLCIPDVLEDYKTAIDYGCKMFTSNNIEQAKEILEKLEVR